MMDTPAKNIETLYTNAGEYAKNKSELWKLKLIDKSTSAISSILDKIILAFIAVVVWVLLTVAFALLIGFLARSQFYGFFIMAAFYGIAGFIIHTSRNKLIKTPILNSIIHHFLN